MKILFTALALAVTALVAINTAGSREIPVSADLKVYETYVSNVFQTATPESDCVTLAYLDTSYDSDSGASIFYNANLNLFSRHPDLRNHNHYLGVDYERQMSQGKLLYLGGKLGLRQHESEYQVYSRRGGSVYGALKYYLTDTILGRMGYGLRRDIYPDFQASDYLENYGFLQFSKFFQTRTTVQLSLDAGRRDYTSLDGNDGKSYATRLTGSLKIAQSLADLTGLQLQYIWHHASRSTADDQYMESGYYSIEDFLDDEYSFSSREYEMTLKHLGPWKTTLEGAISRESRTYNESLIYTNDQERKDRDVTIFLEVEKRFSPPLNGFPGFALHVEFLHRQNDSSDPYYDHSVSIFSIGAKTAF